MATNYKTLVTTLAEQAEAAEAAKAAKSDAPEVKAARAARSLSALLPEIGYPVPDVMAAALTDLSAMSPDAFDRTEGDSIADRLAKMLALDPEDAPASFANVAEDARAAVDAWRSTKPGRRASNGTGEGSTPESQLLSTYGIDAVTIVLTMPEDAPDRTVTHRTHWSSLSNEINKAFKVWQGAAEDAPGYSYGKSDPSAREAWRAAVDAMRAGEVGPFVFTIEDGPSVTITAERS